MATSTPMGAFSGWLPDFHNFLKLLKYIIKIAQYIKQQISLKKWTDYIILNHQTIAGGSEALIENLGIY